MSPRHRWSRGAPRLLPLLAAGLLASCAVAPMKTPVAALDCGPLAQAAPLSACARRITEASDAAYFGGWRMQGRAAISTGGKGGSVGIDWVELSPDDYRVTLSAPVTRQSWRLDVRDGQARLEGLSGGPRAGADAEALVREATGWRIPVEALRWWLQGRPAPAPMPEGYRFAADGGLVGLEQDGWRIDFERAGGEDWPTRMTAARDGDRVRLVVDAWGEAGDGG